MTYWCEDDLKVSLHLINQTTVFVIISSFSDI